VLGRKGAPRCGGARGNQVGFTRAVAGRATFAWVCDVFVLPATAVAGIAGLYPAIRAARPSPAEALRTI
jgi:hypothetical protein